MKVKSLIAFLEQCDPDAEVIVCHQPHYPLEFSVGHATTREDTMEDPEDPTWEGRDGEKKNDVLLVEGSHLRYGARSAWNR